MPSLANEAAAVEELLIEDEGHEKERPITYQSSQLSHRKFEHQPTVIIDQLTESDASINDDIKVID